MGNTHSMNNMSMLDQKRYQAEFLRYSQIPYESQYHQQQQQHQSIHASNMNLHQFNKYKEQQALANPVKVLPDAQSWVCEPPLPASHVLLQKVFNEMPNFLKNSTLCDVKFESKLRSTNNGAILQSGGTISARKDSDCGLHRSKSISETQNTYLSNPHGMPTPPPQYRMQRASTQLSINLQQPMRANLNKNFGSSHDLKSSENKSNEKRQEKTSREAKKGRAPPPPLTSQNNNRIKMTPPPTMQAPEPPTSAKAKSKVPMGQRLFGDTLTKSHQNSVRNVQSQPERVIKAKEVNKPVVSKVIPSPIKQSPMSKINPISYLRRERTFDMSLMQPENKEKFKPKFSPQFQRKKFNEPSKPAEARQMSTQERYRANRVSAPPTALQSELQNATKARRSLNATNNDKIVDKKPLKKVAPAPAREKSPPKAPLELKKSSDNSAISNPTVSASSSFKYSKPQQFELKEPEIVQFHRHGEAIVAQRDSASRDDAQQQMNNFYFGMQEASVDTDNDDYNEADQAQMEAINRFAEDIFKMSGGGSSYMPQSQVSTESVISERELDSDSSDILLNLRPTLPRRQLQIPRFSPVAAWKSLLTDTNLSDVKNGKMNSSLLQLHMMNIEDARHETKIEKIYREPSFNLQQLDNKSGDSGISADKEISGNSPDGQMPQAYLMSSWTPQQDLEEDEEESVDGHDKESYHQTDADKSQSTATNGHMLSLSLPRDNHSVSDKTPSNNFYSLQKFRKSVADAFGSITNVNDNKIQIQNYGVDSNWLLSSQPNSIDELSPRKEVERSQIISQMTSGKHVMYLPTNYDNGNKFDSAVHMPINDHEMREASPIKYHHEEEEPIKSTKSKSKSHKFKFQSTIRQVERRKIAEKLSREAEEMEMHRLDELEAMQKVEEEFQRKRAREKNMIRHQLRIASLEEGSYEPQSYNGKYNNHSNKSYNDYDDDEVDTRTPYISRIIEAKSPKISTSQYKS